MAVIKYLFTFMGALALLGAFYLFTGTKEFIQTSVTAQGVVIDLVESRSDDSITYAPRVQFETSDNEIIEFQSSSSSNPPSYSRGETVEVLYQEYSPQDAQINGFFSLWGGACIVAVIGLVFFLIGAILIFIGISKNKMVKRLKATGIPILADIKGVDLNSSYSVNGKHPFQITAQWQNPKTSDIHLFNSDNIWFDPSDYLPSDKVSILIDAEDPNQYYMDISFLPKLAK